MQEEPIGILIILGLFVSLTSFFTSAIQPRKNKVWFFADKKFFPPDPFSLNNLISMNVHVAHKWIIKILIPNPLRRSRSPEVVKFFKILSFLCNDCDAFIRNHKKCVSVVKNNWFTHRQIWAVKFLSSALISSYFSSFQTEPFFVTFWLVYDFMNFIFNFHFRWKSWELFSLILQLWCADH